VLIMMQGEANYNVLKTTLSPMYFLDATSMPGPLLGLLLSLNVFTIWQAVIWAIGFQTATGVTRAKAALVAGATWLCWALPAVLGGNAMKGSPAFKAGVTVE
jgi:hypothetical protein